MGKIADCLLWILRPETVKATRIRKLSLLAPYLPSENQE